MNRIFVAYDTPSVAACLDLSRQLGPHVQPKIGLEFFLAHGAEGYRQVCNQAPQVFLDLKLHDIPNTVAGAVTSILPLRPTFLTIHASGGPAMMIAARKAADAAEARRPKLLGVTVLTSLSADDLSAVGQNHDTQTQVVQLAKLAQSSGMDGIICAPTDIAAVRAACGQEFILMVPGIRPAWAAAHDQKRVMSPQEAIDAGATYLVIGRPITQADNPAAAYQTICAEIA